jgi:hypothetical protein
MHESHDTSTNAAAAGEAEAAGAAPHDVVLHPALSLCSGIGGLERGLHQALGGAFRVVCYVEREAAACEVLVEDIAEGELDDAPIWTDLATFDARQWRGKVDCVVAGYPCQPFSIAGRRGGTSDPRHLWPHIARIIDESEPRWCFFENVANHLNLGYYDVVKPFLESRGFRVAEGIFSALEVGAPHVRRRLFILAEKGGALGYPRGEGLEAAEHTAPHDHPQPAAHGSATESGRAWPPGPLAFGEWADIIREWPWLSPAQPALRGVAYGLPDWVNDSALSPPIRLMLLGNAVVPAQAARAFTYLRRKLYDDNHT